MSGLDIAKALTEVDDSKFARVTYGVAQADSGEDYTEDNGNVIKCDENYVVVLLDGHDSVSKLCCDCFIKSGYRVKVVGDPSGRYMLYSVAGAIEEASSVVKQAPKTENNDNPFPLLIKNTTSTTNTIIDQVGYGADVVANPTQGTIRANGYYSNNETPFHGNLDGNATSADKWKEGIFLSTTTGSVVTGTSDNIDGSGNAAWQLLFSGNGIGAGLSYDSESHYISLATPKLTLKDDGTADLSFG